MAEQDGLPSLSTEDELLSQRILLFLRADDYQLAQDAVTFLESIDDRLAIDSLANFRDVVNHLYLAAKPETSAEHREDHFHSIKDHLRKSYSYPYQDAIDDLLFELDPDRMTYARKRFWGRGEIIQTRELRVKLTDAKRELAIVRTRKGHLPTADSTDAYQKLLLSLLRVREETRPSKAVAIVTAIGWGASLVLTVVITALLTNWLVG